MPSKDEQIYHVLARVQAGVGGLIAVLFFGLYRYSPESLSSLQAAEVVMFLGVTNVLYHFSLHLWLKRHHLTLSALIQTLLNGLNLFLIIAITGGLQSPYYFLWLLMIISLAAFGYRYTIAVVLATISYYLLAGLQAQTAGSPALAPEHVVQLVMSLATAGLAQWIFHSLRSTKSVSTQFADEAREEKIKAASVMESMGDGVVVVDHAGNITYLNPAAEQLIGWNEANAKGLHWRPVMNLKTPDDKDVTDASDPFLDAWKQNKSVVKNNLTLVSRSGKRRDLAISISPIYNTASQVTGAIAVFRDVSEEKAIERQRSEFVSTASHEMRTPVAAIEGYLSLALNPKVATIDERAKSFLLKAHDSTQHLGELFRDLLSITKLEDGQMPAKREQVNLTQLVEESVTNLIPIADKKGLKLQFESATPAGEGEKKVINPIYSVVGDSARLREVLTNLIDNALKFTLEGGVTVSMAGDDTNVTVRVKDTGVGIAAEDMPHLFQKFYRIDNSATRTIGGTGLGLYLTRSIIELYGGRIWVESAPGQGTTFAFSLPRLAHTAAPVAQPAQIVHPTPGRQFDGLQKPAPAAAHKS